MTGQVSLAARVVRHVRVTMAGQNMLPQVTRVRSYILTFRHRARTYSALVN